MHPLVRLILVFFAAFVALFAVVKTVSGVTFGDVEQWLVQARGWSQQHVFLLVLLLLVADLFVSVPTLIITMTAGFLLGQGLGAVAALLGLFTVGCLGYGAGRLAGSRVLSIVVKDADNRQQAIDGFDQYGFGMIILARAVPILPEITACLAGASGMNFPKFLLAWSLNSVPYVLVATYAGSVSTFDAPQPALFTALGISATLWICWFVFRRHRARTL